MNGATTNPEMILNSTANDELPLSENAMSALSYFCGIIAIVALCMAPYQKRPTVKFNAIQSLMFFATWVLSYMVVGLTAGIVFWIVSAILSSMKMYMLAGILGMAPFVLNMVFTLAMLVTWIVLVVSTAMGKKIKLPVLGKMAERMAHAK